jgi:hypothetical protein
MRIGSNGFIEDEGLTNAVRSNGKSKHPEDINILDIFLNKYKTSPYLYRIASDDSYYDWKKFEKKIRKLFPNMTLMFSDKYHNLKSNITYNRQETWLLKDGVIMQLEGTTVDDLYLINYNVKNVELVCTYNLFLVRDDNFDEYEEIIKIFKSTQLATVENVSIGMVSVEDGGFYIKDFDINKKTFELTLMDEHYGEGFEEFNKKLISRLKTETKGLVLFHGEPGSGKCVLGNSKIKIRNIKTGTIEEINIEDLM